METVVFILFCGVLETSNNPHISILEPCVSQNQKKMLAMWFWLGKKILGEGWCNVKNNPWDESKICVFVWMGEREKNNSFEITVTIYKANEKFKSPIQKGF